MARRPLSPGSRSYHPRLREGLGRWWRYWSRVWRVVKGEERATPAFRTPEHWAPSLAVRVLLFEEYRYFRARRPWRWLPRRLRGLAFARWGIPGPIQLTIVSEFRAWQREYGRREEHG